MDSNHRRYEPADLQSAPFGHSGTPPFQYFNTSVKAACFTFGAAKLYRFLLSSNFFGKIFQKKMWGLRILILNYPTIKTLSIL